MVCAVRAQVTCHLGSSSKLASRVHGPAFEQFMIHLARSPLLYNQDQENSWRLHVLCIADRTALSKPLAPGRTDQVALLAKELERQREEELALHGHVPF